MLILTDAGEVFVASARRIIDELSEAERAASGEYREPRGELIVTAPILFGRLHLAPIVHDFLAAYPQVSVRLVLSDAVIDMAEAHVDVAVRIGKLPSSDLIARTAGHIRWVMCASPDYLAKAGEPSTPEDLAEHDCIAFEGLQTYRNWTIGSGSAARTVTIRPRFSVNTAQAVVEGAAAGLGIARVLSYQAAEAVARGEVRTVLHGWGADPIPVSLVHQPQRVQPLKRRAFLDFAAPRLAITLNEIEHAIAAG
jgi:DNA-binding transcriptional LysR family regulator